MASRTRENCFEPLQKFSSRDEWRSETRRIQTSAPIPCLKRSALYTGCFSLYASLSVLCISSNIPAHHTAMPCSSLFSRAQLWHCPRALHRALSQCYSPPTIKLHRVSFADESAVLSIPPLFYFPSRYFVCCTVLFMQLLQL